MYFALRNGVYVCVCATQRSNCHFHRSNEWMNSNLFEIISIDIPWNELISLQIYIQNSVVLVGSDSQDKQPNERVRSCLFFFFFWFTYIRCIISMAVLFWNQWSKRSTLSDQRSVAGATKKQFGWAALERNYICIQYGFV